MQRSLECAVRRVAINSFIRRTKDSQYSFAFGPQENGQYAHLSSGSIATSPTESSKNFQPSRKTKILNSKCFERLERDEHPFVLAFGVVARLQRSYKCVSISSQ